MTARKHKLESTPDTDRDDGDRESETRIITRHLASAPWERQPTTFLEQAIAEVVLADGAVCVIQEIEPSFEGRLEGSFEVLELGVTSNGQLMDAKRARYAALVKNLPIPRRLREADGTLRS